MTIKAISATLIEDWASQDITHRLTVRFCFCSQQEVNEANADYLMLAMHCNIDVNASSSDICWVKKRQNSNSYTVKRETPHDDGQPFQGRQIFVNHEDLTGKLSHLMLVFASSQEDS